MVLTLLVQPEEELWTSLCPELDVASQGETEEEARKNLIEALQLLLEVADKTEVERRLKLGARVTRITLNDKSWEEAAAVLADYYANSSLDDDSANS